MMDVASQAVLPLRDPTSDMAVIARNGSALVREVREKKEKGKSRQRFWEVAGSKMGKITGAPSSLINICPHHCSSMPLTLQHTWLAADPSASPLGGVEKIVALSRVAVNSVTLYACVGQSKFK